MTTYNPITKIKTRQDTFNIGSSFDHVYYDEENDYSLMDFFNHVKDFFESDMFMIYSSQEPSSDNDNIKVWYDTTVEIL